MVRKPLYQVVKDHIVGEIGSGGLEPGDRVPSEAQLSKSLEVSVGTVRKAIDQLERERRLYRHQGKGTYVSRIDFDNSLFRFFSLGDGAAVHHRRSPCVCERVRGDKVICRQLNVRAGTPLIYLERLGFTDQMQPEPALLEKCWWPASMVDGIQDEEVHIPDLLYTVIEQRFGVYVVRSEETLTAEAVDADTARSLKIKAGAPVVVLRRFTFTTNDKLFEFRETRGRADLFSYRTEIR